eukprot:1788686-Amphidinium_carterae.1
MAHYRSPTAGYWIPYSGWARRRPAASAKMQEEDGLQEPSRPLLALLQWPRDWAREPGSDNGYNPGKLFNVMETWYLASILLQRWDDLASVSNAIGHVDMPGDPAYGSTEPEVPVPLSEVYPDHYPWPHLGDCPGLLERIGHGSLFAYARKPAMHWVQSSKYGGEPCMDTWLFLISAF